MQKCTHIVIHGVFRRVMSFARNIIDLDRWINNISSVIKFSLKIGMGMDNPVTG